MAAPATVIKVGGLLWANRRSLPQLLLGLLALPLVLILIVVAIVAAVASALPDFSDEPPKGSGIPPFYMPVYNVAAEHYEVNPFLLASIHKQESGFSTNPTVASGLNDYGCCAGPMQFNLRAGTWYEHQTAFRAIAEHRGGSATSSPDDDYRLDREDAESCNVAPGTMACEAYRSCRPLTDDQGCVYDDFDSIAAAAHKLRQDGADTDLTSEGTHDAVCAYIGDCAEVDECNEGSPNMYCQVLPRAIEWEQMAWEQAMAEQGEDGSVRLIWPTPPEYRHIESPFGMRVHPTDGVERLHSGIDISPLPTGTAINAAAAGRVTFAHWNGDYGNFVCVEHAPKLSTCYAHLEAMALEDGDFVGRGGLIGFSDSTGNSTGPHLHFEVRLGRYPAKPVDPEPRLP